MYILPALTTQTSLVLSGYHGDTEPQNNDAGDRSKRSGQGKGVSAACVTLCMQQTGMALSLCHLSHLPSVTHHSTICHLSLYHLSSP